MAKDDPVSAVQRALTKLSHDARKFRVSPAQFTDEVMRQVGGPEAFAKIVADILNAPGGNYLTKTRMVDSVLRMLSQVDAKNAKPPDWSEFSNEDLEAMGAEIIRRHAPKEEGPAPTPGPAADSAGRRAVPAESQEEGGGTGI